MLEVTLQDHQQKDTEISAINFKYTELQRKYDSIEEDYRNLKEEVRVLNLENQNQKVKIHELDSQRTQLESKIVSFEKEFHHNLRQREWELFGN